MEHVAIDSNRGISIPDQQPPVTAKPAQPSIFEINGKKYRIREVKVGNDTINFQSLKHSDAAFKNLIESIAEDVISKSQNQAANPDQKGLAIHKITISGAGTAFLNEQKVGSGYESTAEKVRTAATVIECAVRAIWHFGELSANRAQYHTCSVEKLYVEEKNQFIKDIEADFNSKLPSSCLPDVTQPDAPKLKLKFVNSEDPLLEDNLDVDLETSKLFCGTIKDFLSDNPDATEYLIPYFSEKNKMFTDDTLKNYLTDRSNLNLTSLNDEVLLEVYKLARYLNMPDLEAHCMVTIVERFIKTESPILKDGLEWLDHRYAKEFNRLFTNFEEKNQFIKNIEADFNPKLPTSCLPDVNQHDALILKLKFANSGELEVDLETFKLYCGTFKDLLKNDPDAREFLMPSFTDNKMFDDMLKNYLTDKSSLNLSKLNDKDLIGMYKLAIYMDMPDLEIRCMATIVRRFNTGSTVLKDGLEGLDHRYADEFNRFLDDVEKLKTGQFKDALVTRLNDYNNERLEVIKNIGKTIICGLLLIPLPLFPLAIKYIPIIGVNAHAVGVAGFNIRLIQQYTPMAGYTAFCAILMTQSNTAIFLRTYPAVNRIGHNILNIILNIPGPNALYNAIVFTATKIKDATIFIAQSIIQAAGFIYNKVGQGVNKIHQGLQQIPTAVTTGLITSTVLLVAAKQLG